MKTEINQIDEDKGEWRVLEVGEEFHVQRLTPYTRTEWKWFRKTEITDIRYCRVNSIGLGITSGHYYSGMLAGIKGVYEPITSFKTKDAAFDQIEIFINPRLIDIVKQTPIQHYYDEQR